MGHESAFLCENLRRMKFAFVLALATRHKSPCYNLGTIQERDSFMLQPGNPFPNFSLPNQDGKTTRLGDFAGHWLVVYFYPKDDTPGCTIQGKSFTATKSDFDAAGIRILGISADDVASHKNFCTKFAFTIDLLADTNASLMKTLGLGQSEWKGMKFW